VGDPSAQSFIDSDVTGQEAAGFDVVIDRVER
jgi:hypothetical protein